MGYIKEPDGVDLVFQPTVYTEKDMKEVSAFIQAYKRRMKKLRAKAHKTA